MLSPSDELLRLLTAIDPATEVAFVATIDDGARDREIGVGRFSARPDGHDCEFAVTVSDAWRSKGLGSHLMHHLIVAAQKRGIWQMHSSDAADNHAMREFAAHLHIEHRPDPDDATQTLYSIDLRHGPRDDGQPTGTSTKP